MEILVANNHLVNTGGTENYTYAMITELLRRGHHVEYFTFHKGICSEEIEKLGVSFMSKKHYDLILANHKPVIAHLFQRGYIIQTTHGILPGLEEPSCFADFHVCVSEETQKYLSGMGIKSDIILNGIDCERFCPETQIHEKLTSVLSLCQSEEANKFVQHCCEALGVKFMKANKFKENTWKVETEINKADLVVGIGRSLYDAMACGRAVISYDRRYGNHFYEGDGYLDKNNINSSLAFNCTGRGNPRLFTVEEFVDELNKYKSGDGCFMRDFAVKNLNISGSIEKYLYIYYANINKRDKDITLIDCYNELHDEVLKLQDEVLKSHDEILKLQDEALKLQLEIKRLKSSKSWILTSPLRKAMKIIKKE